MCLFRQASPPPARASTCAAALVARVTQPIRRLYSVSVESRVGAGAVVPVNWMSWPTLLEDRNGWLCSIGSDLGQSFLDAPPGSGDIVMAQLLEGGGEPASVPAVIVRVGGVVVGWLAEAQAGAYLRAITKLRKMGLPATCRARWVMVEDKLRLLMLGVPTPGSETSPFFPPFDVVQVRIAEAESSAQRSLIEGLADSGPSSALGTLVNSSGLTVLTIEDHVIGHLDGPARAMVDQALALGFHPTCSASVERAIDGGITVTVSLPDIL